MKKRLKPLYGNYLGICVDNNDPEYRGRAKIFIPHLMPLLPIEDLPLNTTISSVGDNALNGLTPKLINKLREVLPWAEQAGPLLGNATPGYYNQQSGQLREHSYPEQSSSNPDYQVVDTSNGSGYGMHKGKTIVSATGVNGSGRTTVTYSDGTTATVEGDRYLRNNNPGNLEYGEFAQRNGAVGSDGRYAVFPTIETGWAAKIALLRTDTYQKLSIRDAFNRYAPPNENPNYLRDLEKFTGFDLSRKMSSLTPEEFNKLSDSVMRVEGVSSSLRNILPKQGAPQDPSVVDKRPFASPSGMDKPLDPSLTTTTSKFDKATYDTLMKKAADETVIYGAQGLGRYRMNERGELKIIKGASYCGRGTASIINAYVDPDVKSSTGGSFSPVTDNGYYEPVTEINGERVTLDNYQRLAAAAGDFTVASLQNDDNGHAHVYIGGQWHSYKFNDSVNLSRYNDVKLFRLTDKGWAKVANVDVEQIRALNNKPSRTADVGSAPESLDGINNVQNPTPTAAVSQDIVNMTSGVFSVPQNGAFLWLFFQEGNPMRPVYFAASYGADEWKNAYAAMSKSPGYPQGDEGNTRATTIIKPNGAGMIEFRDEMEQGEESRQSVTLQHHNGHMVQMHPYGIILKSSNERYESIGGNAYSDCINRETLSRGDDNYRIDGDQYVTIGRINEETYQKILELSDKIRNINQKLADA